MAGLIFSAGGLLVGMTFWVSIRHLHQWRKDRTRLMPLHIGAIALSYNLLLVSLLTREDVVQWRALIYAPAIAIGVIGMIAMLKYQNGNH